MPHKMGSAALFFIAFCWACSTGGAFAAQRSEDGLVTQLLAACGSGNSERIEELFAADAQVNGMKVSKVIESVERKKRRYRLKGSPVVIAAGPTSRSIVFSYIVEPSGIQGSALLDMTLTDLGLRRIKRLARVSHVPQNKSSAILLAVNPVRTVFTGAKHRQEFILIPSPSATADSKEAVKWKGQLKTKSNSYEIGVRGPDRFVRGKAVSLELDIPQKLSAQPDLTMQRKAEIVLHCTMGNRGGIHVPPLSVYTYNNAQHKAVFASLIQAKRLGLNPKTFKLDEIRVRFRVLDLSLTYYACMRFHAGYAGLQYWPRNSTYAHWFSVWNRPGVGRDKRNRFRGVGSKKDGWVTADVPVRDRGDKNYVGIRNMTTGWRPGVEYTYCLKVQPVREDGEDWTAFSLTATEHNRTDGSKKGGGDRTLKFGSILRYGKYRLSYCNAFMEALGRVFNHQRRQMEFVAVSYRLHGAKKMSHIDLNTVIGSGGPADPDKYQDRYPRTSWLANGRLRLSSGGQTPLQPGELLLDY
ncbi:MAG: hypothetical protein QGH60_21005 [Phycisphaerae bacterium]|jgi:hypothetical protein|nr:hypothetical protein [Phycisphaerae bacterium]